MKQISTGYLLKLNIGAAKILITHRRCPFFYKNQTIRFCFKEGR